jgi:vacuolar protein 8
VYEAGAVPPLVRLLGDASAGVRENAAAGLAIIAADASLRVPVYEAGAVPPLVRLLDDASAGVRENAAGALWNIANDASLKVPVYDDIFRQ